MLRQFHLNKCSLTQLEKPDKLYTNAVSTRLLKGSNKYYIEYQNKSFPNNPHIHIRACDYVLSYHCSYPISGSKIPKWDYILNCCDGCISTNAPGL